MAVNPATAVYGSSDLLRNAAVKDVDISAATPGGATSAKALVTSAPVSEAAVVTNAGTVGEAVYLYDPATGLPISTSSPAIVTRSDSYLNITTKVTNNAIKTGAGRLAGIVVNKLGSADTITIYDSLTATGTIIATITSPPVGRLTFDVAFGTGLTIVTGGTTAGDYTVCYS